MKQLSIALLVVFAFGLVLLAVAFSEGRVSLNAERCSVCGGGGTVDCPRCEDGTILWGAERIECFRCGGTSRLVCPAHPVCVEE